MANKVETSEIIEQMVTLLQDSGEYHWSSKFKALTSKSLDRQTTILKSWFGGAGSLNDLYLSDVNGHSLSGKSENELNRRLDKLRDALFDRVFSD